MATVYIQPGTGTGSGTKADPYYYSELGTAETNAGNGGTILFTDGTYTFTTNQAWDNGGSSDMTYKSENDYGAYLLGSGTISRLTIGSGTTTTMKIEGFRQGNIYWYGNAATTFSINKIKHVDTISGTRGGLGIFYAASSTNLNSITNSSFLIDYSGTDRFLHTAQATTLDSCSFFLKCSSVASNGITGFGGPGASTNTIFMSDNADAIDATVINTSICTNCCVFQMDSGDSSGGTDNIFADPQFVDAPNGDLRLRPSSPCIGAATAS
jgi:hypothetical protein